MLRWRTVRGPSTGVFHMPVWTVLSCQVTSRGSPTLTESKRPITFLSNDDHRTFGVEQKARAQGGCPDADPPSAGSGDNRFRKGFRRFLRQVTCNSTCRERWQRYRVLAEFPSTLSSAGEVIRIPFLPEETTRQLDEILHHHRRLVLSEDQKHVGGRRRGPDRSEHDLVGRETGY